MLVTKYYQKLVPWLLKPLGQSHRHYLEAHPELLDDECERLLTLLINEHQYHPDELQRLRIRRMLLRDARIRGGTEQAIQAAYVNMCGGLILNLPAWLLDVERHLLCLAHVEQTERQLATCKIRLSNALDYARIDRQVAPETVAELYYQLGLLFISTARPCTQYILERTISYHQEALQIYTATSYPLQYAKVLIAIGNAYLCASLSPLPSILDQVFALYQLAQQSYHAFLNTTLLTADEATYQVGVPTHLHAR
jgi:hypothetical protein